MFKNVDLRTIKQKYMFMIYIFIGLTGVIIKYLYSKYNTKDHKKPQTTQKGIQNIGNTCYLNVALQIIKQMDSLSPLFLDKLNSKFAQLLSVIFLKIQKEQNLKEELSKVLALTKEFKMHEIHGGDSYVCLINILSKINNEINQSRDRINSISSLNEFQNYYTLQFNDGYQCQQCYQYHKEEVNEVSYIEEADSSFDVLNIEQLFTTIKSIQVMQGSVESIQTHCQACDCLTSFKLKRTISHYPQYMIVKFPQQHVQNLCSSWAEKIIRLSDQINKIDHSYRIIGYCSYTGFHYTYSAKYDSIWITFNDKQVYSTLNLFQQVIYLILYKV